MSTINYKKCDNTINKSQLMKILDDHKIKYKKNLGKQQLCELVEDLIKKLIFEQEKQKFKNTQKMKQTLFQKSLKTILKSNPTHQTILYVLDLFGSNIKQNDKIELVKILIQQNLPLEIYRYEILKEFYENTGLLQKIIKRKIRNDAYEKKDIDLIPSSFFRILINKEYQLYPFWNYFPLDSDEYFKTFSVIAKNSPFFIGSFIQYRTEYINNPTIRTKLFRRSEYIGYMFMMTIYENDIHKFNKILIYKMKTTDDWLGKKFSTYSLEKANFFIGTVFKKYHSPYGRVITESEFYKEIYPRLNFIDQNLEFVFSITLSVDDLIVKNLAPNWEEYKPIEF
jgi:hypothetical protein